MPPPSIKSTKMFMKVVPSRRGPRWSSSSFSCSLNQPTVDYFSLLIRTHGLFFFASLLFRMASAGGQTKGKNRKFVDHNSLWHRDGSAIIFLQVSAWNIFSVEFPSPLAVATIEHGRKNKKKVARRAPSFYFSCGGASLCALNSSNNNSVHSPTSSSTTLRKWPTVFFFFYHFKTKARYVRVKSLLAVSESF